jgi:hypothetical protein
VSSSSAQLVDHRVAAGIPKNEVQNLDLDLFDVRAGEDVKDERYIAHFWSLVYGMKDAFDVAGGRGRRSGKEVEESV